MIIMSDKYNEVANKLGEIENHINELKNNIENMIQYVNAQKIILANNIKNKETKNGNQESSDEQE